MTTEQMIDDVTLWWGTRDDAAKLYAAALRHGWAIDYPKLNGAIIERWSESGLRYIKREAWKILRDEGW